MWLASVRDIAIVLLALESLVIGVLLLITLLETRRLMRVLRDEVNPLLKSLNETTQLLRGTTGIVSQTVVKPLVQVSSYAKGVSQAFHSFFAIRHHTHRPDTRDEESTASQPQE